MSLAAKALAFDGRPCPNAWRMAGRFGKVRTHKVWGGWYLDFGRVGSAGDRFRSAPGFIAEATLDRDPAVFERLMQSFAEKYSDGWNKWEPRFRKGYTDRTRILIRYHPLTSVS